jgi:hypothetical protein
MALLDDDNLEYPNAPPNPGFGQPGYQGPQGPFVPGYDPGPNWNGGIAPSPSDPYQNWNNGSPVDAPLQSGYGWEWSGPSGTSGTAPIWDSGANNWSYGRWNQVQGKGLGYTAPSSGGNSGGSTPAPSNGSVPSVQPNIQVPGSTLPSDISGIFNQTPTQTPIQSAYQDALLKYLNQSQQTPSLTDPILGPQAEVYRVQQQRNQERNRRSAVERASATGMNQSGYVDRQIDKGVQEQNFNTAAFNATLMGSELNRRRQELQSALQLARATGDAEAQRELQTRLAQVSAMMQQQGLNLQGQLGRGDLSLRLLQTLLGNDQFYDQLGVNTSLNLENLNQNALKFATGGY